MLFYLHGGDLPSWILFLLFALIMLIPFAVEGLPFLFFHVYFKIKENKINDDKSS
jgi:hypothetical protein